MRLVADSSIPSPLLMVSHCVPDPSGDAKRTRAWQLLQLAAQVGDVYLACVMDGPVNLAQWRTVAGRTRRLALERAPLGRRLLGRCLTSTRDAGCDAWALRGAVRAPVSTWRDELSFDALLCTHPALWPELDATAVQRRACDVGPTVALAARARLSRLGDGDAVIVRRLEDAHPYRDLSCGTVLLPHPADESQTPGIGATELLAALGYRQTTPEPQPALARAA